MVDVHDGIRFPEIGAVMNKSLLPLCVIIAGLLGGRAVGQEELPPVEASPVTPNTIYPCDVGYAPGWSIRCCCRRPFGSSVRAALTAQVDHGIRAHLTLYHYDFQSGESAGQLSEFGLARLDRFARISMQTGFPIIVEVDYANPGLNAARKGSVLTELTAIDPYFTEDMVVVGTTTRSLRGHDADLFHQTELQSAQNRGPISGSAIGD
jgi:hypothetical protein